MILCDVAREDTSVILSDLKALTSTRTVALAVGFPLAIGLVYLATLLARPQTSCARTSTPPTTRSPT